ncbi:MAG: hypothetical protein ACJA2A_002066 [Cycloclasticus pugetii]|jgi:hypothetical protein
MSIGLMGLVFKDEELQSNEKLVLLALADNANDEGICYPSLSTLQVKTSLSRPTVSKILKKLAANDYLFGVNRARKKGGRSSNMYLLFPAKNYPNLDEFFKSKFEAYECVNSELSTGQSKEALLPPQSKEALLGLGSQSKEALLESESLLKSLFNHKGFSCLKRDEKTLFLSYLKLRKKMGLITTMEIKIRLLEKYHAFGRDMQIIENAINANWKDFYSTGGKDGASGKFSKTTSAAQSHHDTLKQIAKEADEREMGERVV